MNEETKGWVLLGELQEIRQFTFYIQETEIEVGKKTYRLGNGRRETRREEGKYEARLAGNL